MPIGGLGGYIHGNYAHYMKYGLNQNSTGLIDNNVGDVYFNSRGANTKNKIAAYAKSNKGLSDQELSLMRQNAEQLGKSNTNPQIQKMIEEAIKQKRADFDHFEPNSWEAVMKKGEDFTSLFANFKKLGKNYVKARSNLRQSLYQARNSANRQTASLRKNIRDLETIVQGLNRLARQSILSQEEKDQYQKIFDNYNKIRNELGLKLNSHRGIVGSDSAIEDALNDLKQNNPEGLRNAIDTLDACYGLIVMANPSGVKGDTGEILSAATSYMQAGHSLNEAIKIALQVYSAKGFSGKKQAGDFAIKLDDTDFKQWMFALQDMQSQVNQELNNSDVFRFDSETTSLVLSRSYQKADIVYTLQSGKTMSISAKMANISQHKAIEILSSTSLLSALYSIGPTYAMHFFNVFSRHSRINSRERANGQQLTHSPEPAINAAFDSFRAEILLLGLKGSGKGQAEWIQVFDTQTGAVKFINIYALASAALNYENNYATKAFTVKMDGQSMLAPKQSFLLNNEWEAYGEGGAVPSQAAAMTRMARVIAEAHSKKIAASISAKAYNTI